MINRIKAKINRETAKLVWKKKAQFPNGRKVVSFSFDDFPLSAIKNGARILESRNVYGTYYTALGMSESGDIPSKEEMLAISDRGHEVGCHTYTHINCGDCSAAEVEKDCAKNRSVANEISGLRFESFAFPFGEYKPSSKRIIKNTYANARTVEPGINRGNIDMCSLYGVPIDMCEGIKIVKDWIAELENNDGWIIFFTHDVRENPSTYGSTIALFTETLDLCIDAGFEIMTVREAGALCTLD